MSLLSNKSNNIFFLTKNNKNITSKDKISLILSPEFYWAKIFEIPVNNKSTALELLPALYEEFLPNNEYSYQVEKINKNTFMCFAYSNSEIFEEIKKLNIPLSQIDSIYFAQNEFNKYQYFSINNINYTYVNNLLVQIPNNIKLNSCENLHNKLNSLSLSKIKVDLKLYKNIMPQKYLFMSISFLIIISIINFSKYSSYKNEISLNELKKLELKKEYKLPLTSIQTRSLIKSSKNKVLFSLEIREKIKYIISYKKLSKDTIFTELELKKSSLILKVKNVNENNLKEFLRKKYKILNSKKENKLFEIEIKL